MKTCVVVIPIHSPTPSAFELISFKQCYAILGKHPIKVVAPKGMDVSAYKKIVSDIECIFIDPKWQSNILQYNKLKVSRFFYGLFSTYEYLLTYELDAFVFTDDLLYWCQQGNDYIGAPWFEGHTNETGENKLMAVGNSGFSLRRIPTIQNILKNVYMHHEVAKKTYWETIKKYIKYPFYKCINLTYENITIQKNFRTNEDLFFAQLIPSIYPTFKIASLEDASRFSFEVSPEIMFELNNQKLPFGCHAWWRYNLEFWRPHIEKFGHKL